MALVFVSILLAGVTTGGAAYAVLSGMTADQCAMAIASATCCILFSLIGILSRTRG